MSWKRVVGFENLSQTFIITCLWVPCIRSASYKDHTDKDNDGQSTKLLGPGKTILSRSSNGLVHLFLVVLQRLVALFVDRRIVVDSGNGILVQVGDGLGGTNQRSCALVSGGCAFPSTTRRKLIHRDIRTVVRG